MNPEWTHQTHSETIVNFTSNLPAYNNNNTNRTIDSSSCAIHPAGVEYNSSSSTTTAVDTSVLLCSLSSDSGVGANTTGLNKSQNNNQNLDPNTDGLSTAMTSGAPPPPPANNAGATDPAHIPRRNLSEAFEELYISAPVEQQHAENDMSNTNTENTTSINSANTPGMKQSYDNNGGGNNNQTTSSKHISSANLISPTGVADLHAAQKPHHQSNNNEKSSSLKMEQSSDFGVDETQTIVTSTTAMLPYFKIHEVLKRDLSQALVNRVSLFAVIHDINKEASAMAANDDSGLVSSMTNFSGGGAGGQQPEMCEDSSPLVEAVKGPAEDPTATNNKTVLDSDMLTMALIDEEKWLLSAIETRGEDENRSIQACPPTFSQAMGEREYENPLTSLSNGSRTQLWKPSRSWWEAKSGKNPWIEPKSHNKRWRYLWPLIHYHKFLAKCIKKLKRNGVDVKMSVSPVAAFLREEVCAVSDHLAAVSLFDSDEWMSCLYHFSGWTDTSAESEASLRLLIAKLPLRPMAEHGDVESPLLRSQIDEHYLRAMANARSQMEIGSESDRQKNGSKTQRDNQSSQNRNGGPHSYGPMEAVPPHMVPSHVGGRGSGLRRPRLGYPPYPYQWGYHGWQQPHYQHPHYGDDASVHSSMSGDAFPEYGMYPGAHGPNGHYAAAAYPHPHAMPHSHMPGGFDPNMAVDAAGMYQMNSPYHFDHAGLGYFGHHPVDPSMAYAMHQEDMNAYYGMPPPTPNSPHNSSSAANQQHASQNYEQNENAMGQQTPFKYNKSKTPGSPYWGHLDTTIAMGLSTPQTHTKEELGGALVSPEDGSEVAANGQPLLLRQSQYYGYGPVSNYGPPSPATQFMMSPQANFAMNYGYGYSPAHGHLSSHFKQSPMHGGNSRHTSSSLKTATPGLSPSAGNRGKRGGSTGNNVRGEERESPSTVETITESESLSETA